jgi:hypothetical protein
LADRLNLHECRKWRHGVDSDRLRGVLSKVIVDVQM